MLILHVKTFLVDFHPVEEYSFYLNPHYRHPYQTYLQEEIFFQQLQVLLIRLQFLLKTENELKELITAGKISPPVNRFGPGSGNRSPNRNYTPQQGGNPPRMF